MKNLQKGFRMSAFLVVIALVVIGGSVYIYENKKPETQSIVDSKTLQSGQVQPTNTQDSQTTTNLSILSRLVTDWKKIAPKILPDFPDVNQAFYGYPDVIQFIGNNHIVISYQDDFNPLFAVLSYDSNRQEFSYLDGLKSSPFNITGKLWDTWKKKYGEASFIPQTYQFSSTRTGDAVYSSDWKLITKNPFVSSVPFVDITSTLLIVQIGGGVCPYGACSSKISIRNNGTFTVESGDGKIKNGNLGVNAIKNLQALIESSNYSALRKTPFTGKCPTAYDGSEFTYDGSEFIYKFQTSHGEEIIGNCTTKIDLTTQLFKEVQNILTSVSSQ